MENKVIKDINGKIVTISKNVIKKDAKDGIAFWNSFLRRKEKVLRIGSGKGWRIEAEKNLKYWKHLLKQVS